MTMKNPAIFLSLTAMLLLSGCLKEPGIGGTASISGKVYAYDYDDEMVNLRTQYYAPDEDVFIIYGNDSIYSDRTRTSYDGSYRFRYLRPGTYTVFAYSKNVATRLPPPFPVKQTVEITGDNAEILLPEIEINK
jgi:hypothetical protein